MTDVQPLRVVLDRIDGRQAILLEEDGRTYEILAEELPGECRHEGAVLDVPLDSKRVPLWLRARRNRAEEERLRAETRRALDALRKRDPGGDVQL